MDIPGGAGISGGITGNQDMMIKEYVSDDANGADAAPSIGDHDASSDFVSQFLVMPQCKGAIQKYLGMAADAVAHVHGAADDDAVGLQQSGIDGLHVVMDVAFTRFRTTPATVAGGYVKIRDLYRFNFGTAASSGSQYLIYQNIRVAALAGAATDADDFKWFHLLVNF